MDTYKILHIALGVLPYQAVEYPRFINIQPISRNKMSYSFFSLMDCVSAAKRIPMLIFKLSLASALRVI